MNTFVSSLLCVYFLAASPIPAEPTIIEQLDQERESLRSLRIIAEIETPKPNGRKGHFSQHFTFKSPRLYRSELKMGIEGDVLTVSDGDYIWSYQKKRRVVYVQPYVSAMRNLKRYGPLDPITALTSPDFSISELYTLERTVTSDTVIECVLRPKISVPNYDLLVLTLSVKGLRPLSAETFKRGRWVARVIFRKYEKNVTLNNRDFVFVPPRDVKIRSLK